MHRPRLAATAIVTGLAMQTNTTGRRSTALLAVSGGLFAIGQLSEPIAWRAFRHPKREGLTRLAIVTGNIVLPSAMLVQGIRTYRRY